MSASLQEPWGARSASLSLQPPGPPRSMSLQAWEWEDEDQASMGPVSSMGSFRQSGSECGADEHLKDQAWAQESDSERRGSSESSERPTSVCSSDAPHVVPCKFTISLAFPLTSGHRGRLSSLVEKYRQQPKPDKPVAKAHRYYHIEHSLLPDDGEHRKVDVLLFPAVAKVFLDSGVKTIKPWQEGDRVWVSWTQAFNINVTKELLKKINFHKITLKVWDTKEKVSKRVKYYRLKPSGFMEDMGSFEEVKSVVLSQRRLLERGVHVKEEQYQDPTPEKPEKPSRSLKPVHDAETLPGSPEDHEKLLRSEELATVQWGDSKPVTPSGGATTTEAKELIEKPSFSSLTTLLEKQKFQSKRRESDGRRKVQRRRKTSRGERAADVRLAGPVKHGSFSIQLEVLPLLAGWESVVSHGSGRSASILDCFLTLKTEVPLMTEEQKQDLNPMTIKIKCVSSLPSQPVPFRELERLCSPVHCRYQFHRAPVHRTEGRPHGSHVYFQDVNVIFLGAMHPSDLREYLEGPPMVVEVHDRDRKSESYSRKPTLFGEDPLDAYLNLEALISPGDTESNPFATQEKMWDPHGVARVSFADLLLGHKYLNLAVPVHSCEPWAASLGHGHRRGHAVGPRGPREGVPHSLMLPGDYVEASCLLKLRVDVAVPLRGGLGGADPTLSRFGRVVFVFESRQVSLLHSLLQDVTMINARALALDSYPLEDIQQILSAFKIRVKTQEQPDLDVLTGVHLLDGKVHLLILEGLADHGLQQLWARHQSRVPRAEQGPFKALYNSELRFRQRLYADLETILYRVRLFRPLAQLVKQAALYVRKAVPPQVFQALSRAYCICRYSSRLREVIMGDLLPSSAMIKELSQEFGMPMSQEDLTERKLLAVAPAPSLEGFQGRKPTLALQIHSHQEKYLQWRSAEILKSRGQKASLIQRNISAASRVGRKPPSSAARVMRVSAPSTCTVHNYSIQTLNSVELAKKELYREMAKEPGRRFTYSQKYLSATVGPLDPEEEERRARRESRQAWRTPSGFQTAGLHTMGTTQPLGLPPISAATEEWREKALFANLLEPVLQRERWGWDLRHQDFNLYARPPAFLELPPAPKPGAAGRRKAAASRPEQHRPSAGAESAGPCHGHNLATLPTSPTSPSSRSSGGHRTLTSPGHGLAPPQPTGLSKAQ
ncbi:PREDICTED: uncharacterized protein KIAA1257 homolog isoform X2 [Capra hircus]|uniref:uncharacterized protein KIAA1257 homolog isoform X2 n=1 Tax=Capra hircus TaxID=9925 RepID=UPI0008464752|nr:PREDICTED: uncharacterized protein KIAA1257 homolog isoform X2 [Capra hircus]